MVTQETLGTLIPFVTKKRKKKNYQEILSEYLNYLSTAGNKLNSVSKEMKTQFFMIMNDMALNKNDELKYLILMREEYLKYKLKIYYFHKWKCRALYNRDLLDEEDPFKDINCENIYQQFKKKNLSGQGGNFDSLISKNDNNFNDNNNEDISGSKFGNNENNEQINNKNNFDLINFDEDEKIIENPNELNNKDKNPQIDGANINFVPNKNSQLDNIFNSIDILKNKINGHNLMNNKLNNDNLNCKIAINNDNIYNNKNINDNFNKNLNTNDMYKNNIGKHELLTNNKNSITDLQNSIKVLEVQKDINDALNNTNTILSKISSPIEKKESNTESQKKNEEIKPNNLNKSGRFDELEKDNIITGKSNDNKLNKNFKNKISLDGVKNNKNFDLNKLYKYHSKAEMIEEQEKLKYKNSKYISTKYKDYLHTGENKSKNKNSKNKNNLPEKINNIYKEILNNLETDENLLKRLERNESSRNKKNNKKIFVTNKKRDISADKIRDINQLQKYYNQENLNNKLNNFENSLIKNGFFTGGNKKNKKLFNDKDDKLNLDNKIIKEKGKIPYYKNKQNKLEGNFDYIKKIKGNLEGLYGKNQENNNDEDFDKEYDELFHPKNRQLDNSDYSNSVFNILNNLDNQNNNNNIINYNKINYGYDDLINSINEPKIKRINKRKISRRNIDNKKNVNSRILDEQNYKSYILAPMKGIPITNISFRARLKYFSDRKEKNIQKLLKEKREEEKEIYTFQPKTGDNSLNVIKYKNDSNNRIKNKVNYKKKVDYDRINNLYLDYKDKKNKIEELTKEYYKNSGISFIPKISERNQEIKQYKNKLGQIPYLDRFEIYNASKQPYEAKKNVEFYKNDLFN